MFQQQMIINRYCHDPLYLDFHRITKLLTLSVHAWVHQFSSCGRIYGVLSGGTVAWAFQLLTGETEILGWLEDVGASGIFSGL